MSRKDMCFDMDTHLHACVYNILVASKIFSFPKKKFKISKQQNEGS